VLAWNSREGGGGGSFGLLGIDKIVFNQNVKQQNQADIMRYNPKKYIMKLLFNCVVLVQRN